MKYTSLLSLLFLFFLSACHTTNYFMMPVYKPAEQIFPATGSTVLVVNNAVEQSPMVGTTFVFSDGSAEKLAIRRDSMTNVLTNSIAQYLYDSKLFEDVLVYNFPLRSDSIWYAARKLTTAQIDTLVQQSGSSWILSLETLPYQIYMTESQIKDFNMTCITLETILRPYLCLYDTRDGQIKKEYILTDTLRWEGYDNDLQNAFLKLPDISTCLTDAAFLMGEVCGKKWLPVKTEETRFFISTNDPAMREAEYFLKQGQFEEAYYMWEHIFESSKREQHRIYSSFNLAVLLETQHRLEEALVWLNKCDEINPEKVVIRDFDIQQYQNLLTERIRQKELLRQQGVIE